MCGPVIFNKFQEHSMGKELTFYLMVLGKLNICMQKNEGGPLSYNICKDYPKLN